MLPNKVVIMVCFTLCLPTLVLAGALERYRTPSNRPVETQQQRPTVDEGIYEDFRYTIRNYSQEQKDTLRKHYNDKFNQALREKNFSAASHYRRLLDILNER